MLQAVLPLPPPPLVVEIEAPRTVRSGEPLHVVARLVNRSERPVLVVRPEVFGYALGLSFGGGLFREGKPAPTTPGGRQAGQWMLPHTYGPEMFITLKPGEGTPVEDVEYRQIWARPFSGLIADLDTTPRKDLPPGEYTIRFSYRFRPEFHVNRLRKSAPMRDLFPVPPLQLSPEGRTLYHHAWTGEVTATAPLTVRGA